MLIEGSNIILVWGEFVSASGPGGPPAVSVSTWSEALGMPWQRWNPLDAQTIPDAVRTAKVAIVNLFHTADSRHIEQIKAVNPSCYCIACPDACVDIITTRPDWIGMLRQMQLADAIGGRTTADCRVYGALLNKPTFYFPSPIGPDEYFLPFREMERSNYVFTLDHSIDHCNNSMNNVAALAALQRETGCEILYAAQRDWTPLYAQAAGLNVKFCGNVGFLDFVQITARARLCIDVYTRHSYGRQQVLCAMVGTPIIGSEWCKDAPGLLVDPFKPREVAKLAKSLLEDDIRRKRIIANQYRHVEEFRFEACRKRLESILEQIGVMA